jgi:Lrp/AsnC family leucine-responsive transcriptional regulator
MDKVKGGASLDQKDKLLLKLLQEDAQLSFTAIGTQLELTKMSVSNRIKRLKRLGILEGSHYRVNPERVGHDYLLVSQVTCETSSRNTEKVAASIAKIPEVQTVYLTFGPHDIIFIARTRDKESAKDLLSDITDIDGIRSTLTTIPHTVVKESLQINLED